MAPPHFDLPFLPDDGYLELLLAHQARVRHLYFGIGLPDFPDARPWQQSPADSWDSFCEKLALFPLTRRQALLNGRILDPRVYLDDAALQDLVRVLDALAERELLQGLVIADLYLAQALADTAPGLCAALSASPSVNCRIDSAETAALWLDRLAEMGFQPASLLVPDPWLNRSLGLLQQLADALRGPYPDLEIYLLANEGCLYRCPFSRAHEVLIAGCREQDERFCALGKLHNVRGCARRFYEAPWELLKSPFIRPEDLGQYAQSAHGVKLCGRTLEPAHLARIARAYFSGAWKGNLIDLLDAPEALAGVFVLPNQEIPADFITHTGYCKKRCADCGYCVAVAEKLIRKRTAIRACF